MSDKRLSSWKEIADYLGWDERTCLRWEKKLGLPVHRIDPSSKRSRVFAYQDELSEWLKNRQTGAGPINDGDGEVNNLRKGERSSQKRPLFLFLFGGLAVLSAIVLFFVILLKPTAIPQPADFKISGAVLTILDAKGRELWSYDTGYEHLKNDAFYREHFQIKKISAVANNPISPYLLLKDIDGDGHVETLFTAQVLNDADTGPLCCFDHEGKLLWRFEPGREMTFGSKIYSNDYWIKILGLCDLEGDGRCEIVVVANQIPFFPTQVVVLDASGRLLGEYWNSGRIEDWMAFDLDGDDLKELIFGGKNNEYRKPCLVVLRPGQKKGGSPQFQDHYKCPTLKTGTEHAYLLFPRTDIDRLEDVSGDPIVNLRLLHNKNLALWTAHARINYELKPDLSGAGVQLSDAFRAKYERYVREGKIRGGMLNEMVFTEALAQQILYFDGRGWTTSPPRNAPGTRPRP